MFDRQTDFRVVQLAANRLNLCQRDGFSWFSLEDQIAQRSHLESLLIRIVGFGRWCEFPAEGMLDDGPESGPAFCRHRFGLPEQSIVQFERRFHVMG